MLLKNINVNYEVFEYGDFFKFKQLFERYLIENPEILKENVFDISQYLIHKIHPLDCLEVELTGNDTDYNDYINSYIQEQQSKSLYKIFDGSYINFISDLRSRLGSQCLKNE